ncbi:HAD-IIB family hydrolase [Alkalicoccobacillus porphyridii]|uniref:HAD-IIB family hydrolase n=1 Tax=Alkalicoccobacillus porphyridii TaxID=2597270 RepID=UPI00163DBC09|nr:HAD-IIB family hydrolase [Alkalicoccobacillus porphyridii]
MLISDLDGTLLNRNQQISQENKEAIKAFEVSGGKFTIATGRLLPSALPFIHKLDIQNPVILGNGTCIYCPKDKQMLRTYLLTDRDQEIDRLWKLRSERVAVLGYIGDRIIVPYRNELILQYEQKDNVQCEECLTSPSKLNKLLVIGEEIIDAQQAVGELLPEYVQSDSTYLELLPTGISKGRALQELRQMQIFAGSYITAVGDQLNDSSMLIEADYGYAVGNAHEALKAIASEITIHHEEHAIAAIIHAYCNIKRRS